MRTIEVERHVTASPERVWELVGDVEHWDRLLPTIRAVTRLDGGGPVGVGARFQVRQPGLPPAAYEVTRWSPGGGFTWVSTAPGARTTATHELIPADGGTRLRLGIEWTGPLAGLVGALLGTKARRLVEQEGDAFARLAAAGGADLRQEGR
jgi:carbon monoxide dehydrogenase subunit G